MSGPKRADVQNQLNVARNRQAACANLIGRAENSATASVLRQAEQVSREADAAAREALRLQQAIGGDLARVSPDSVNTARTAAEQATREVAEALAAARQAKAAGDRSGRCESAAATAFSRANQAYESAVASLNRASAHYLHGEMAQASEATRLFDIASGELQKASGARRETAKSANAALESANRALAAARSAESRVRAAREEAEARQRAEEEARRIAEEKRRRATLAVDQARAAFGKLDTLPHDKFRPGDGERLRGQVDEAGRFLQRGSFDEAAAAAAHCETRARQLEAEVTEALREFERQRAEAEAHVTGLQSTIDAMDNRLIREWADNPAALDQALAALTAVRGNVAAERFADAGHAAQEANAALGAAFRSAAENQSAHENRQQIGDAIMASLRELDFDVSFDPGSRTEPLRISGQTPDDTGRGDFDIAIPLSGEVGFHVETPEGDTSCVGAVTALQERLAERGITWQTTDWGHATGTPLPEGRVTTTVTEKETVKVKETR